MTYSEKLKDPRWQRKRLEILNRDNWKCRYCGDKTATLHVHHLFYISGRYPWEYLNGALITLCETCHSGLAEEMEEQREYCDAHPEFAHCLFSDWEDLQDVSARIPLPPEVFVTAIAPLLELGDTCHIVRTHDLLQHACDAIVADHKEEAK